MSEDSFIGKPLPSVGDIIRNENGLNYRVVCVQKNEEDDYSVTMVPCFEWVRIDEQKEGKLSILNKKI